MSDKFYNTYVDVAIGTIHEQLASILQLKTQLKIANDLVLEKDGVISTLSEEREAKNTEADDLKQQVSTIDSLRNTINGLTAENESLKTKGSHLDTCINQVSEMKKEIIARDQTIQKLKEEIEKLKAKPEQVIMKPKETTINKKDTKKKETNSLDDF